MLAAIFKRLGGVMRVATGVNAHARSVVIRARTISSGVRGHRLMPPFLSEIITRHARVVPAGGSDVPPGAAVARSYS